MSDDEEGQGLGLAPRQGLAQRLGPGQGLGPAEERVDEEGCVSLRYQHTLSIHPINTPNQPTPLDTPFQPILSIHPLHPPLSTNGMKPRPISSPSNTIEHRYQHALPTHSVNVPSHHTPIQFTLSTYLLTHQSIHPITPPYQLVM